MNSKEIKRMVKCGENAKVEFKEAFDADSLGKAICAFANAQGGTVLLGMSDRGEPKGIGITNRLKSQVQDIARNKLLFSLMQRMDLVEQAGTGIARMRRAMGKCGLNGPKLQISDDWFTIVFDRSKDATAPQVTPQVSLTALERKILEKIRQDAKISRSSLSRNLGIGEDTVKEYLNSLKKKGALIRIGRTSGGHWEVKKY